MKIAKEENITAISVDKLIRIFQDLPSGSWVGASPSGNLTVYGAPIKSRMSFKYLGLIDLVLEKSILLTDFDCIKEDMP